MTDKKPDPLTMLYSASADFRDGDFALSHGVVGNLAYITTTDIAAAKKAGWKTLADAQKPAKKSKKSDDD